MAEVVGSSPTSSTPMGGDRSLSKAALIALMAVGSIALWIVVPIFWLWLGSQIQANTQETGFGPYVLVLVGIAVSVAVLAKGLQVLNRTYSRVSGAAGTVRVRAPWHRSMRGEDDSRPPRSVLDVVMVISVSIAATAMAIWFFFFAGSSLPT
jgi:hypothetical protein